MQVRSGTKRAAMLAFAAMALALVVDAARPAEAQAVCAQIRARIAQLDRAPAGAAANRRFAAAARSQRAEIATITRAYQAAGCGGFFQGAQCSALDARRRQMQANLAQLEAQAGGGGVQSAQRLQQRAQLVAAYDANGCGATREAAAQRPGFFGFGGAPERDVTREYRTPDSRPQTAYREGEEPRRPGFGNFIEHLFGARRDPGFQDDVAAVPEEQLRPGDGDERPRNVGHRAVCVRLCDGAFFPMTSSPRPGAELGQEELCQMQCPGAEVALYRMRDDQIENAVSVDGAPYTALPNALRFRQRFDAACTCRPRNGSWAQAFSDRADPTLRSGDQVISAEQARLLSMPADQRQAVREEIASEQRARREAERLERIDRSRGRGGAPRPTIGIDGTIRAASEPEPVEIRGTAPAVSPSAPAPVEVPPEPDRRPVRVIGPLYAPRADTPSLPSGG
ncbi:DUF2865 domain-containing protein [Phreatobacter cathodiphilus]|uniref:DUF2865 domain-containing protein n=1 Tax=Phreatobacter cathodiphilus TaxID=1868589 RepID=UPI0015E680B2|nr:DUF2865 domain-containing protein [Phreatobacter cathodiphilus]